MKCPLCNSKVRYHGLFTLECAGKNCQNYVAHPDDDQIEWPAEPLDWPWFVEFGEWLERKYGQPLKIAALQNDTYALYMPNSHHLAWPAKQSTKAFVRETLSVPNWNGVENPFYFIFANL